MLVAMSPSLFVWFVLPHIKSRVILDVLWVGFISPLYWVIAHVVSVPVLLEQ
jgi:hypothetical protein